MLRMREELRRHVHKSGHQRAWLLAPAGSQFVVVTCAAAPGVCCTALETVFISLRWVRRLSSAVAGICTSWLARGFGSSSCSAECYDGTFCAGRDCAGTNLQIYTVKTMGCVVSNGG